MLSCFPIPFLYPVYPSFQMHPVPSQSLLSVHHLFCIAHLLFPVCDGLHRQTVNGETSCRTRRLYPVLYTGLSVFVSGRLFGGQLPAWQTLLFVWGHTPWSPGSGSVSPILYLRGLL